MSLKNYVGKMALYVSLSATTVGNVQGAETVALGINNIRAAIAARLPNAPPSQLEIILQHVHNLNEQKAAEYKYVATINDPKTLRTLGLDDTKLSYALVRSNDQTASANDWLLGKGLAGEDTLIDKYLGNNANTIAGINFTPNQEYGRFQNADFDQNMTLNEPVGNNNTNTAMESDNCWYYATPSPYIWNGKDQTETMQWYNQFYLEKFMGTDTKLVKVIPAAGVDLAISMGNHNASARIVGDPKTNGCFGYIKSFGGDPLSPGSDLYSVLDMPASNPGDVVYIIEKAMP
jgi:hypothetical protein